MPFYYRVTKYNPKNRDSYGRYMPDEWIFYDVISEYGITFDKYFEVESKYIAAIFQFMNCNKITALQVNNLSQNKLFKGDVNTTQIMKEVYKNVKEDVSFSGSQLDALCRLILREHIWCKLVNENMQVHFG